MKRPVIAWLALFTLGPLVGFLIGWWIGGWLIDYVLRGDR